MLYWMLWICRVESNLKNKVIIAYDNREPDEVELALALYRRLKAQGKIRVQTSKFNNGARKWYCIYLRDYDFPHEESFILNRDMTELDERYKP